MLLAIDSGNTNIVFAVFDDKGAIRGQWRASATVERSADEYGVWLGQLMALEKLVPADVDSAIIASVVPATLFSLKTLCRKYFRSDPLVVGEPGVKLGLRVDMDRPEEVGADRLVNAVGAHETYGGPLIIVDFGTATTFDVVDGDGSYQGGAIAPGINLSLKALHLAAAKLPLVSVGRPAHVIGKGTVEAMQSGIFWGYVGLIEGLVERICGERGEKMDVIATGGLAPLFLEAVPCIRRVDQELTLRGLLAVHRLNRR